MDRSPTPPPCFPSYVKARWAFAQLRFNSIGKGEEERCTHIRLRAQHMKFKEVHFHSKPVHPNTATDRHSFPRGIEAPGLCEVQAPNPILRIIQIAHQFLMGPTYARQVVMQNLIHPRASERTYRVGSETNGWAKIFLRRTATQSSMRSHLSGMFSESPILRGRYK